MRYAISIMAVYAALVLSLDDGSATDASALLISPKTFMDPVEYCKAKGTLDAPDATYAGPAVPDWMVTALYDPEEIAAQKVAGVDVRRSVVWRCMQGEVFGCVQTNSPICGKANVNQTPTTAMVEFCASQPNASVIPLSVIGHENPMIFEWTCRGRRPTITRQIFQLDGRGFPSDLWKEISPQQR
jgi:hypothetical protein